MLKCYPDLAFSFKQFFAVSFFLLHLEFFLITLFFKEGKNWHCQSSISVIWSQNFFSLVKNYIFP